MYLFIILLVIFIVIEYNIHNLESFEGPVMGKLEDTDVKVKSKALVNNTEDEITEIQTSDLYIDGPMKINDPKDSFELCIGTNCYKQKDFKNLLSKSAIPYQYFNELEGGVIPSAGVDGIVDPIPNNICIERHIDKNNTNEKVECKKPRKDWTNLNKKDCDICLKPWHLKILNGNDYFHISDKTNKSSKWNGDTCKNDPDSPECGYTHIRDYQSGLMHEGSRGDDLHDGKGGNGHFNYIFNKFYKKSEYKGSDLEKKSRFKMVNDDTSLTGKYCKTI
jgi:hypothetical protein